MALTPGQHFAGYDILAELGRGGMGAVYQARQVSLQRLVALKILPPHLAEDSDFSIRFQGEAIAAANLNHPNIVQVFAAGECDGIRYIAMEYVEGETIQHRLRRCGRLPLTEALDIAYHVAAALDYAWQSANVIHRDVKPDNIFLAQNGNVKLGDFGIAKMLREGASSVTVTGRVLGSPHFISPEQARGQRDIDCRADMYSLGCTLHYMMTGRTVFEGPDFMSIMYKHVNEEPAPLNTLLPHCPASVASLIDRMLLKDREARPSSYAELVEEIVAARHDAAVWEASDDRQRRRMAQPVEQKKNSQAIYALAALLAILTAAGIAYAKRSERPPQPSITLADPSDRRDFVASVQRLAPFDRVQRVMAKMRELNPEFDGKERFTIEDGVVTEITLSAVGVKNLWPLCALKHLRAVRCTGDAINKRRGDLTDLSPLAELPELEEVDVSWTNVEDLRPLSNLWLRAVRCAETRVQSLAPLADVPLAELDISGTDITDLTPLQGKALMTLGLVNTRVTDLSPLRDAPIREIRCDTGLLRSQADVVQTWRRLESVNDQPPSRDLLRRSAPRATR